MILMNDGITLELYKADKAMVVMLHNNKIDLKVIDYEELVVTLTKEQIGEIIKFLTEEIKWL